MAVTITPGSQVLDGMYRSVKIYSESTSTGIQTMDPNYEVLNLGMGTATGFGVNRYLLATDGNKEGREVLVLATATGEAKLVLTGTSTGAKVFQSDGDFARVKQVNGTWYEIQTSGPTDATATGTA
jgi:hypothetical protein